ncbi:MAG TPA: glycoside hydrolase family 76 protein, partial [Ktedonobacteraceae bacterium]|nr:glycoside hydrolase family 76 protein [Ktedonobacteraceae bacterium]
GQTTWTYNQGIILGGLTDLYKITGNSTYLSKAESIANATLSNLVYPSGILREPCEPSGCGSDGEQFKGLFMRNLAYLYDEDHQASYYQFLATNANSLWANDRNGSNQLGLIWAGPFDTATPARQSSAMIPMSVLAEPWTQGAAFARGAQDPSFGHNLGSAAGTQGWACSSTTCTTANHMIYGPYISYLPLGTHTIHFHLSVSATSTSTASLVTLDVRESNGGNTLASSTVPWSTFSSANAAQDFSLTYTNTTSGDPVEFRVYWNNVSDAPTLTVSDIVVDGGTSNWVASNLNHSVGRLDSLNAWEADPVRDTHSDFLSWGPYTTMPGTSSYTAYFELKEDNFNLDTSAVATIDVRDNETGQVVASQNILRNNFPDTLYHLFPLTFSAVSGHHYEFRVYWDYSPSAPRLTERGVYVQPAIHDTQVSLPYNLRGIGTSAGNANLDGVGDALKPLPGTSVLANYHSYQLGSTGSGASNVLRGGAGVSANLPAGSYQELHILATGINGNQLSQPFTVTYTDNSTATQNISLSDWFASSPQPNERFAVAMDTRWGPSSTQYGNIHLFDYTIVLNSGKTVKSLTLPNNSNVIVVALTLSTNG